MNLTDEVYIKIQTPTGKSITVSCYIDENFMNEEVVDAIKKLFPSE